MKKCCSILLALAMLLSFSVGGGSALAETAEPVPDWVKDYYLDPFETPTEDYYLGTSSPVEGSYNSESVTKGLLKAEMRIDAEKISVYLYEDGEKLVKNGSLTDISCPVLVKKADGSVLTLAGKLPSGGDCVVVEESQAAILLSGGDPEAAANSVAAALCAEDGAVSVFVMREDQPAASYLFTVNCGNFAELYTAEIARPIQAAAYAEAEALLEAGNRDAAAATFAALGDYSDSAQRMKQATTAMRGDTYTTSFNQNSGNVNLVQDFEFIPGTTKRLLNYDNRLFLDFTLTLDGAGNYTLLADSYAMEAGKRCEIGDDTGLGMILTTKAEGTYVDNGDGTVTTSPATHAVAEFHMDTYSRQMKDPAGIAVGEHKDEGIYDSNEFPEVLDLVPETVWTLSDGAIVSYLDPNAGEGGEEKEEKPSVESDEAPRSFAPGHLGSGRFDGDSGTWLNVYAEWTATAVSPTQAEITITLFSVHQGIDDPAHDNNVHFSIRELGNDRNIQHVSMGSPRQKQEADNYAVTSTEIGAYTFTVDVAEGEIRTFILDAAWDYGGSYGSDKGRVKIDSLECGGGIQINRGANEADAAGADGVPVYDNILDDPNFVFADDNGEDYRPTATWEEQNSAKTAYTDRPLVNFRVGPGQQYKIYESLPEGAEFKLLGYEGNWAKICCKGNMIGYVWKDHITFTRPQEEEPAVTGVTIVSDDEGTKMTFNSNGTYKFAFESYGIVDEGTWTYEGGVLTLTDVNGVEYTADGDPMHLHYGYSGAPDQLMGEYTIPADTFDFAEEIPSLTVLSDDRGTTITLVGDGTYRFWFEPYSIEDLGAWQIADGILSLTDANGKEIQAEGTPYKLHYVYSRNDALTGDYTIPVGVFPLPTSGTSIPSDDLGTGMTFFEDGTYLFTFDSYAILDAGTWTFEDGVLTLTDANGKETKAEGESLKLHYAYSMIDMLTGDFSFDAAIFAGKAEK